MSFLSAEDPDLIQLFETLGIDLLWHPSFSNISAKRHFEIQDAIADGQLDLDVLVVEGGVVRGPARTGMFDTQRGKAKKDIVAALAKRARFVVAIGTCASFGGFGRDTYVQMTGLQFLKHEKGGLLGADFKAGSGMPVINLAGCPCHPSVVINVLTAITEGMTIPLDEYNRPVACYGTLVHQGCTRNEYHEYRVEEMDFGQKGCLFFHMGCHGPLVTGPCNKVLWNRRSSKTRAGVPCFGCTDPGFPQDHPMFHTRNIEGVPVTLPPGINRANYLVYKAMAAAAAPERLKNRKTDI